MIDTQPETENRSPGNRLLTVVALIIVSAIGLGFKLEWFHIGSESTRRQNRVNLTVDQKQFQEEEQKVRKRVRGKNKPNRTLFCELYGRCGSVYLEEIYYEKRQ